MVSGADGGVEASTGVSGGGANMPRRIVTAASLFDGHDAAINVMRRLIQAAGAEVIHLGHDRSARDGVCLVYTSDAADDPLRFSTLC